MQQAPSLQTQHSASFRSASATAGDSKFTIIEREASTRRRAPPTRARSGGEADDMDDALARGAGSVSQQRTQSGSDHKQQRDQRRGGSVSAAVPAVPLLAACDDPVSLLVGLGALLVRGFGGPVAAATRAEVERRACALLRVPSITGEAGARAARRGSVVGDAPLAAAAAAEA
ncbi:hypothetical protein MNEG_7172 [Monoraphidium neglectum]|uniref:Uncharacterized protein n=1 Tax=Monoraphidium neglectum TaxID=145388 RepID=A0A0D2JNR1_9CHLO|nr:hypothetical protein MNEG_7172 [Monoraphidium neglectum]KIZ00788.1 hypothetical protein MNEG_7172 [Monoraphidium neglectum]|eukprot:XP_013899807.1 hypothetical protein MNEG_7172 [Monoraphidium neglectum]